MLKLQFQDRRREAVWLVDANFTIGRSANSSLMIDDASLHDIHAEIRTSPQATTLYNHSGGTAIWVNGIPVSDSTELKVGDKITLGQVDLELIDPKSATEFAGVPDAGKSQGGWSIHSKASWLEQNRFPINGKMVVGRDSSCDITLPLEHLSRRHVEFDLRGGQLYVKDLDSSNGTFLNGERVRESALKPGDRIKLDVVTFEVAGPQHDPHKTIIRTAPAAAGTRSTQQGDSGKAAESSRKSTTSGAASRAPKSKSQKPQKLAATGKQPWIKDAEEAAPEPKKARTGVALLVLSAALAIGAVVFVFMSMKG